MPDGSIVCSDLGFSWPDGTPVFDGLCIAVPGGRTGLVAANGSGKTTLLRLVAGDLRPQRGSVAVEGTVGYLPQHLPFTSDQSAAQVLGIEEVLTAVRAIESGDVRNENFEVVGNDWDIEGTTRAELDRLGLPDLALERRLGTLSGSQVVTLGLAAQLLKRPDVLLLNEPSTNLDRAGRDRLMSLVRGWIGCLVVVSHDRDLLDQMDRIAALTSGEIRLYGGNFTAYEGSVECDSDIAER